MARVAREFDRFLRAAHRRWVIWRVTEHAGLASLCACALALPLVAVLWLHGDPAPGVVALALIIGAFLGAIWGILRRPSLLETAVEADRQFHLQDLLGTALTLARGAHADHAVRASIVATADHRCRRLAPSRMVLNKLGARAWAGIGLANAMVMTVALMTASPARTVARIDDDKPAAPAAPAAAAHWRGDRRSDEPAAGAVPQTPRAAESRSSSSLSERGERAADGDSSAGDESRTVAGSQAERGSGDGTGAAAGQTDRRASLTPSVPSMRTDRGVGAPPAAGAGAGGAGTGTAVESHDDPHDRATGSVTSQGQSPAPPWRAPTWPADRARALREVERGAVPDRYRDMMRAYFSDHEPDDHR